MIANRNGAAFKIADIAERMQADADRVIGRNPNSRLLVRMEMMVEDLESGAEVSETEFSEIMSEVAEAAPKYAHRATNVVAKHLV